MNLQKITIKKLISHAAHIGHHKKLRNSKNKFNIIQSSKQKDLIKLNYTISNLSKILNLITQITSLKGEVLMFKNNKGYFPGYFTNNKISKTIIPDFVILINQNKVNKNILQEIQKLHIPLATITSTNQYYSNAFYHTLLNVDNNNVQALLENLIKEAQNLGYIKEIVALKSS